MTGIPGTGTLLWSDLIGASNNKSQIGGQARNGFEWVFQSGDVIVLFYPDADNKKVTINAEYYEVV